MKLIQDKELETLIMMIDSDDKEMRNLASSILKKKEAFRFNMITIILFNIIVLCIIQAFIWYFGVTVGGPLSALIYAGVYLVLVIFQSFYVSRIIDFRKKYDNNLRNM